MDMRYLKKENKICWSSQLIIKVIVLTSAFEDGWTSPWWLWLVLGHCQNIYKGKRLMLTAFFDYWINYSSIINTHFIVLNANH